MAKHDSSILKNRKLRVVYDNKSRNIAVRDPLNICITHDRGVTWGPTITS